MQCRFLAFFFFFFELQRDMVTQCHGMDRVEHEVSIEEDEFVGLEPKREVRLET